MFVLFAKPFVSPVSKFSVTTMNIWIYMERHFKRKVSLFQFIWSSLLNYRKLRVWHFIYSHVLSLSHSFGESLNFPFDMLKSYFSLFSLICVRGVFTSCHQSKTVFLEFVESYWACLRSFFVVLHYFQYFFILMIFSTNFCFFYFGKGNFSTWSSV